MKYRNIELLSRLLIYIVPFKSIGFLIFEDVYRLNRTHLELLDATLLLERDLRLLRESPRLTTPFPVILKCRNL